MENSLFFPQVYVHVLQFDMTKIAIILVLVGLTVMASAYRMRPPHFNQGSRLQSENLQDERAQLIKQLQGKNCTCI